MLKLEVSTIQLTIKACTPNHNPIQDTARKATAKSKPVGLLS